MVGGSGRLSYPSVVRLVPATKQSFDKHRRACYTGWDRNPAPAHLLAQLQRPEWPFRPGAERGLRCIFRPPAAGKARPSLNAPTPNCTDLHLVANCRFTAEPLDSSSDLQVNESWWLSRPMWQRGGTPVLMPCLPPVSVGAAARRVPQNPFPVRNLHDSGS